MARSIDYGSLMHEAMRGLIREVMKRVEAQGLPGEHHFFITFDTRHPGVKIAEWLADRYPEEMTVVMQHWYDALSVDDDGFSVTLNFGDRPEPLYIPFDAIRTFVDPSVEFGLRFESHLADGGDDGDDDGDGGDGDEPPAGDGGRGARGAGEEPRAQAEIVSLDRFRK